VSARGVFDLRFWAEGVDERTVWALVTEFQSRAQAVAPDGVEVRYTQIRDPARTKAFAATMRRRRKAA
jgi:hypothetical protein